MLNTCSNVGIKIMKKVFSSILIILLMSVYITPALAAYDAARTVRIKDIAHLDGVRDNQIVGYGVVVGLAGTGDNSRSTQFTNKFMLQNFGTVIANENDIKKGNAAAVIVTSVVPPFARNGDKLDVTVSSLADAKSLEGGVLVSTQLFAPNGEVVAVAQGPISTGGTNVNANGSKVRTAITNSARIPNGAIVERDMQTQVGGEYSIKLVLNKSDYTMASRVAQTINENITQAKALDGGTVEVFLPERYKNDRIPFLAIIENITVKSNSGVAKVVINERTGTIVIGSDVKLMPAAVAHGNLTVTVTTTNEVSQPDAFSGGSTQSVQNSNINVNKTPGKFIALPANSNLNDLVRALNTIGVAPFDLISILQALKAAGSLQASIELI
jgi:flagellar P-ring protein precursor FlgI